MARLPPAHRRHRRLSRHRSLATASSEITGNYAALAVDMGDHIVVLEGGQSEARGLAVMAAAKQAIPGKPIRFVVNTHSHFDHASGLATVVAEGATILTHENNEQFLERALSTPRTLVGDSLAKANRKPNVEGVGDRRTLKGSNGKVDRAVSRSGSRAQRRHADGLSAGREGAAIPRTSAFRIPGGWRAPAPVNPSLTGAGSEPGAAEARLRYVHHGASAESGSSADARRSDGRRRQGRELISDACSFGLQALGFGQVQSLEPRGRQSARRHSTGSIITAK